MKSNSNYRQIGIRGDCVYAIYSAPTEEELSDILINAIEINTFQKMFQKILQQNQFINFKIGIGLGASETLIIRSGKKKGGINDNIWIGETGIPLHERPLSRNPTVDLHEKELIPFCSLFHFYIFQFQYVPVLWPIALLRPDLCLIVWRVRQVFPVFYRFLRLSFRCSLCRNE